MAERRRTRGAADEAEPAGRRRPARRREREPVDRDEPETVDAAEPELADEELADDAELADEELADDAELADGPAGANGRKRGSVRAERGPEVALTAKQAARAALRQIMELTAKPAEGITDVAQTEDGWAVGVEVVEDRRIPSSADILATYQATIGTEGELMSYRRLTRYMRGRGDTGEGS
jgi:hypothetical protein